LAITGHKKKCRKNREVLFMRARGNCAQWRSSGKSGIVAYDNVRVIYAMRITVLALDGLFDTGLAVTLDALGAANKLASRMMGGTPKFNVTVVGVRKRVRSGQGFTIPVQAVTSDLKPDWVIVPALGKTTPDELIPALDRADVSRPPRNC
jgi:hypothetical protein